MRYRYAQVGSPWKHTTGSPGALVDVVHPQPVDVVPVRLEVVAGQVLEALVGSPEEVVHGADPILPRADERLGWTRAGHLERGGYRVSAPRSAVVVERLDELGCSVTAKEIADRLRDRGEDVGVASIYRALQLLDGMRLMRRVDIAEARRALRADRTRAASITTTLSARAAARCKAFEDPELEQAIERLAGRVEYSVGAHDVTLRGIVPPAATA